MTPQQHSAIDDATRSEGVKMSEIESLTLRVRELSQAVDWWNSAMIWGLALAAIAAVFVVIATRIVVNRSGRLSEAQELLNNAKDRQLQGDLKAKDIEIGSLKLRSDTVETELAKQRTRAATAERSLLELQERVKLRRLSAEQRKKLIDSLKSPTAVAVAKGPIRVQRLIFDEAAQPFAEDIKEAFGAAGWQTGDVGREVMLPGSQIPIGIAVVSHSTDTLPPHFVVIQQAFTAAGLAPTLGKNNNVPEGTVEILIGVKP
jgi:hypothetical protein